MKALDGGAGHDSRAPEMVAAMSPAPLDWPKLERVMLVLCSACLSGEGGECHTPGCALWLNRAPDLDITDKLEWREPLE